MINNKITFLILCHLFVILSTESYGMNPLKVSGCRSGFNLSITLRDAKPDDTLCLYSVNPFYNLLEISPSDKYEAVTDSNGQFIFNVEISNGGYYQVGLKTNKDKMFRTMGIPEPLLPVVYLEKGDNITVHISKRPEAKGNIEKGIFSFYNWFSYKYSGTGSVKLYLLERIDSIFKHTWNGNTPVLSKDWVFTDPYAKATRAAFNYVSAYRTKLSDTAYWIMQSDIVYSTNFNSMRFAGIQSFIESYVGYSEQSTYPLKIENYQVDSDLKENYNRSIDTAFNKYRVPIYALEKSLGYLHYTYHKSEIDCLVNCGMQNPDCTFQRIVSNYNGTIRDKALLYLFFRAYSNSSNLAGQIKIAEKIIKDPDYLKVLESLNVRMAGSAAFNFVLPDSSGRMINYKDLKDKIVVLDFWYSGCGACSNFYHNVLSKVEDNYSGNNNVVFVSISIDKVKSIWLSHLSNGLYTSNRSINLYTNGDGFNSPIVKNYKIQSYPTFIVLYNNKIVSYNSSDMRSSSDKFIEVIKSILNKYEL